MIYGILAVVGLAAGILGGLLGIGGSIVMIPCMRALPIPHGDQHLYQATAMIVNFFVAAPSVYYHLRAGAVRWDVVRWMAPAAAVAVVGGVMLSEAPVFRGHGEIYLAGIFGLFLLYVAYVNARALFPSPGSPRMDPAGPGRHTRLGRMLAGLSIGLVGGLLGVGGGIVAVPLQQRFLRIPLRSAIANSAATIVLLSIVGATLKNHELVVRHHHAWHEPVALALALIPTAIIGGLFGARLTHVLPLRTVRAVFVLLMLIAGLRMAMRAAGAML